MAASGSWCSSMYVSVVRLMCACLISRWAMIGGTPLSCMIMLYVLRNEWKSALRLFVSIGLMTDALDAFKMNRGLILTYDQEESVQHKGYKVEVLPVWKWLLTGTT